MDTCTHSGEKAACSLSRQQVNIVGTGISFPFLTFVVSECIHEYQRQFSSSSELSLRWEHPNYAKTSNAIALHLLIKFHLNADPLSHSRFVLISIHIRMCPRLFDAVRWQILWRIWIRRKGEESARLQRYERPRMTAKHSGGWQRSMVGRRGCSGCRSAFRTEWAEAINPLLMHLWRAMTEETRGARNVAHSSLLLVLMTYWKSA